MPNSPDSSGESVSSTSSGRNQTADPAAQAAASDSPVSTEVDAQQPPRGSFGQTRRAASNLFRALRHDLQASSALAKSRTAASVLRRKLRRSMGLVAASAPIMWMTAALAKARRRIRNRRANPVENSHRRPLLAGWWKFAMGSALLVCLLVTSVLVWALKDVPWSEIRDGTLKPVVVLETADGAPLVRQGPYQGPYARYDQFPPRLIDAVLSIEDRRFMDHFGVDPRGIGRAFLRNLEAGSVVEGGSTITQQLIKLQYLDSDRTIKRKIQEVVIAFWLEWKLGKREILTRYLNSVYLGAGATGMPAAARIYFNKDISDLDLPESAMLAGLLRAPSQWNPIDNFEGARQRTMVVLDAMTANGKITAQEAAEAKGSFARLHPTTPTPRSGSWFADWISPQASEIAGSSPGSTTVRTTLVPQLQQIAERIVKRSLDGEGKTVGASQAALVAMTPDGAVVAMVGGRDYKASQFNRAVTAMRQPGSTFKLFVYYAALKAGLTLSDQILDAPIEIDGWSPENSGGNYSGWVTLAEAFARSLNAASVALAQEVGLDNVIAAARELGIDAPLADTPSLALGTSEVNLLNLTSAYASVQLGKAPVKPWGITDFQAAGQPKAFRVGAQSKPGVDLSPYQSDLLGLLQLVVERGTGRGADPGTFAAGKTGTSQNNRDAWFVGFTDALVVGVWVGNDDDAPMKGVTGGALPAHIWRDFIREATTEPSLNGVRSTEAVVDGQGAPQSCNITACSRSYRSFRPSDCTYQPYSGGRRLCEK
ncbi:MULTISPECIES: PBP1A family penicillin-binding protein [Rhizobium]|uniref:PBP1A family penicillin-binding protein n=1 Tax=Rhizobium TaxID=379 RepID=UPI001B32EC8E|nr:MULTISPECIES: PBP1A family penicillin-binding protein [Rhizobium]MBX4908332.1 PBP1A family penicillin-binding protein [Rhizobium bangladeshense]MBX5217217.1 PBP1A family penicillin-binding protein [Rhizobium sp. NLR9a]MBX5233548.1 PBP1A family penicillin-binding protein [Rhizobium sp. NLR4a]MBX5245591.1 PBP1A family penicillin-binding protein [Rhizobium sp. NLR3b]MBX5251187.1 PBP1A family penicillin-binding protein [Rhizobium sp. NLR4b]